MKRVKTSILLSCMCLFTMELLAEGYFRVRKGIPHIPVFEEIAPLSSVDMPPGAIFFLKAINGIVVNEICINVGENAQGQDINKRMLDPDQNNTHGDHIDVVPNFKVINGMPCITILRSVPSPFAVPVKLGQFFYRADKNVSHRMYISTDDGRYSSRSFHNVHPEDSVPNAGVKNGFLIFPMLVDFPSGGHLENGATFFHTNFKCLYTLTDNGWHPTVPFSCDGSELFYVKEDSDAMGVGGLGGTKDYEMRALLTNTDKQYCWLDQNLGSVGAPAFSTDYHSRYFFQWGNSNVAYTVHSDHTVSPSEPSHTERPDSWNGDPCRKLLGPRWRLPVRSEMDAIFATYGINSPESAYNSLNLGADGWYAQSESHGYDFRLAHRGSGFKFYFLRDGYMRAEQGKTYGNITSYDRHCMPVRCISEDIWR